LKPLSADRPLASRLPFPQRIRCGLIEAG